jgi:hypothetical protein
MYVCRLHIGRIRMDIDNSGVTYVCCLETHTLLQLLRCMCSDISFLTLSCYVLLGECSSRAGNCSGGDGSR